MNLLFTKSKYLFSDLICSVTQEPVSHVAIQINNKLVLHSNFHGVNLQSYDSYMKDQEYVLKLPIPTIPNIQQKIDKYEGSFYDIPALVFLGASLLIRRYLKIPLPKSNLWQASGMFICTEFANLVLGREIDSMITPYKLYLKLLGPERSEEGDQQ